MHDLISHQDGNTLGTNSQVKSSTDAIHPEASPCGLFPSQQMLFLKHSQRQGF